MKLKKYLPVIGSRPDFNYPFKFKPDRRQWFTMTCISEINAEKRRDLRLYEIYTWWLHVMIYTCDDCCLRWRLTLAIRRSNRDDCLFRVSRGLRVYPSWASGAFQRSWPSRPVIESPMHSKAPILPYLPKVRKVFLTLRKRRPSFSFLPSVTSIVSVSPPN